MAKDTKSTIDVTEKYLEELDQSTQSITDDDAFNMIKFFSVFTIGLAKMGISNSSFGRYYSKFLSILRHRGYTERKINGIVAYCSDKIIVD